MQSKNVDGGQPPASGTSAPPKSYLKPPRSMGIAASHVPDVPAARISRTEARGNALLANSFNLPRGSPTTDGIRKARRFQPLIVIGRAAQGKELEKMGVFGNFSGGRRACGFGCQKLIARLKNRVNRDKPHRPVV